MPNKFKINKHLLHLVDLVHDLRILTLQQVVVVVAVIDLSARAGIISLEADN